MHKVIFKSLHMDDYKVIEEEAEHTSTLVTGTDPKSHTDPLKFPLLWAATTHPYIPTASCLIHDNSFDENHCSNSAILTQEHYHKETQLRRKQVWFMTRCSEGSAKDFPSRVRAFMFSLLLILELWGKDELMLITMTMQVFSRDTENTLPL